MKYVSLLIIVAGLSACGTEAKPKIATNNSTPINNPSNNPNNPFNNTFNNPEPGELGSSCLVDSDCSSQLICVAEVCLGECEFTTDCQSDWECVDISDDRFVCIPVFEQNNPDPNNPDPNNLNNPDPNNPDPNNLNNPPNNPDPVGDNVFYVFVEDTSRDCDASAIDPGSDFAAMILQEFTGAAVAWAEIVDYMPKGDFDYMNAFLILNGFPSEFGSECPIDFSPEYLFSTGCGGQFVARFLGDDGSPVKLESGLQISTIEWGAQCGGSNDDSYSVATCADSAAVTQGDYASCTNVIGGGSGQTILAIP